MLRFYTRQFRKNIFTLYWTTHLSNDLGAALGGAPSLGTLVVVCDLYSPHESGFSCTGSFPGTRATLIPTASEVE